jgi:hypothetical protein
VSHLRWMKRHGLAEPVDRADSLTARRWELVR